MIEKIVKDYINHNKTLFSSFTLSCILHYVLNIIVTSKVYSDFFKKKEDMVKNVRNVCILWISKFIVTYVKCKLEEQVIPTLLSFIRHSLFTEYINSNYLDFNDTDVSGDVKEILELSRISRDFIIWVIQLFIPILIILLFINLFFLYKFPLVGIVNIISTVVNYFIIHFNYKILEKDMKARYDFFRKLNDKYEENINNLMNIFLNDKIKDSINENKSIENEFVPIAVSRHQMIKNVSNYLRISTYLSILISMYLVYRQKNMEDFINVLLIYTFYIGTLETLFEDFPFFLHLYTQIGETDKILTNKVYHKLEKTFTPTNNLQRFQGNIEFKNISFSYPTKKGNKINTDIINNLNWKIIQGEHVALLSKSGSGKTTTMKLLLSFYKPGKGNIFLDGIDLSTLDPQEIRQKINYINQKTLLINDTIINNMKYGNNKSDQEIIDLLHRYDLLTIFRDCDKSPETCLYNMVDTNGTNMSLGMQKIIFLIRGLLKDEAVVYIFDEPLSSVDPSSRQKILRMINDITRGKTLIIITHDKVDDIVEKTFNLDKLQGDKNIENKTYLIETY